MANTIRLKRASGSDPSASDLVTGELAVRTDTAKLFTKKDNNSIAEIGGGITDLVSDTSPQLGGDLQSNGNDIDFADNDKARFGNGNDLQIYHSGSQSIITDTAHPVFLKGNQVHLQSANGNMISCYQDAQTELFFNENKKLATTSSGVDISGALSVTNGISLPDLKEFKLGDNNDLIIVHTGFASYINNNSGDLYIRNDNANDNANILIQARDGENSIYCHDDGAVELYYDGSKKLETISTGIQMSGDIKIQDNHRIKIGAGEDLQIFHNGTNSIIHDTTSSNLNVKTSRFTVLNAADTETMLKCQQDGSVELYHDNIKKFETTSSGIGITGNATSSIVTLTDGSNIAVDLSSGTHFTVTLGGNRTFTNSGMNTSSSIGSSGSIFIVQDGTGSRTAAFQSDYKFAGGTAPTLSTAANAVDRLDYVVRATNVVHAVVTLDVK